MIRIVTAYDGQGSDELRRLKRRRWGSWDFVVAGEWSQSPYHQGKQKFAVRGTADRRTWALLDVFFPVRIVAVAVADRELSVEEAAGEMMWAVREKDGPYVDGVHDYGDVDPVALWRFHDAARERSKAAAAASSRARTPESPAPPPPQGVPPGSLFVCSYLLYVGIDDIDEEAWLARAGGVDTLWLRNMARTKEGPSAPSADAPDIAARRLLERSIRGSWAFQFPKSVGTPGLVSEEDLKGILAAIRADLERNDAEARSRESGIVRAARELRLEPEPTGTGPVHWQARCPGTNHPLFIQAETGTFGCGWCRRKGGEAELRAFVEERRSRGRT